MALVLNYAQLPWPGLTPNGRNDDYLDDETVRNHFDEVMEEHARYLLGKLAFLMLRGLGITIPMLLALAPAAIQAAGEASSWSREKHFGTKRLRKSDDSGLVEGGASNQGDEGGDDGDKEDRSHKRQYQKSTTIGSAPERNFACPFFKHDPGQYQTERVCNGPGWRNMSRLKEHLYRKHAFQPTCLRCNETFSQADLNSHLRDEPVCGASVTEPVGAPGRMTKEQEEQLRRRHHRDDEWKEVFATLFPEVPRESIPSPYYQDVINEPWAHVKAWQKDLPSPSWDGDSAYHSIGSAFVSPAQQAQGTEPEPEPEMADPFGTISAHRRIDVATDDFTERFFDRPEKFPHLAMHEPPRPESSVIGFFEKIEAVNDDLFDKFIAEEELATWPSKAWGPASEDAEKLSSNQTGAVDAVKIPDTDVDAAAESDAEYDSLSSDWSVSDHFDQAEGYSFYLMQSTFLHNLLLGVTRRLGLSHVRQILSSAGQNLTAGTSTLAGGSATSDGHSSPLNQDQQSSNGKVSDGSSITSPTSIAPSLQKKKRKREGDGDEEKSPGKRPPPRASAAVVLELRLACPFYKKDPASCTASRSCTGPGWTDIHRLKQHLSRRHKQPIFCYTCHVVFKTESALIEHSNVPADKRCTVPIRPKPEGMTRDQRAELSNSERFTGYTVIDHWNRIFTVLFPGHPVPLPFYEPKDAEEYERFSKFKDYVVQELPRRLCPRIYPSFSNQTRDEQATLLVAVETVVHEEADHLFQSYVRLAPPVSDYQGTARSSLRSVNNQESRPSADEQKRLAALDQEGIIDTALGHLPN